MIQLEVSWKITIDWQNGRTRFNFLAALWRTENAAITWKKQRRMDFFFRITYSMANMKSHRVSGSSTHEKKFNTIAETHIHQYRAYVTYVRSHDDDRKRFQIKFRRSLVFGSRSSYSCCFYYYYCLLFDLFRFDGAVL